MHKKFTLLLTLIIVSFLGFKANGQSGENAIASNPAVDKITVAKKGSDTERPTHPFSREWLISHAEALSKKDFQPKQIDEDNPLSKLSYDQYRAIEFERSASIWQGENRGFRVGLLHPGFLFKIPVKVNLVVNNVSRRVLYDPKIFNYGNDSDVVKGVRARGYAGFRINTEINKPGVWDEFLVFQGGSYFRALGKSNWYGLSARGLAINTGKPEGEEFPAFTEFWIERPNTQSSAIVVHALLESPSLTGAYSFKAVPGRDSTIEVNATLFARNSVGAYGIAPLTSMFLFDATNPARFDDFRPAVHDSNGLLMINENGEKIWRPLANPKSLQISAFNASAIKGFGLMQRSREFSDFEDGEARYERRPSVWIEPIESWGQGHVELIEIPSDKETNDNIVAFWQPDQALDPGKPLHFHYNMIWSQSPSADLHEGRINATRAGRAINLENVREFNIDFQGRSIPKNIEVHVEASNGKIVDKRGFILEANGLYRVSFKFRPSDEDLTEFRLWLTAEGEPWGETWLYRWTR